MRVCLKTWICRRMPICLKPEDRHRVRTKPPRTVRLPMKPNPGCTAKPNQSLCRKSQRKPRRFRILKRAWRSAAKKSSHPKKRKNSLLPVKTYSRRPFRYWMTSPVETLSRGSISAPSTCHRIKESTHGISITNRAIRLALRSAQEHRSF